MMRRDKRGAIELSMSFIVIIIISVAVLAFGLYFARTIFRGMEDKISEVDAATEKQLERMLMDPSKLVAIPYTTREVKPGDMRIFPVGVVNKADFSYEATLGNPTSLVPDDATSHNFLLEIEFKSAIDKSRTTITVPASAQEGYPDNWIRTLENTRWVDSPAPTAASGTSILKNKMKSFSIGIVPAKGAETGTYIYDLKIKAYNPLKNRWQYYEPTNPDPTVSGRVHKLYVQIP
ncbi:MAG: hypothetical protein KJ709_07315 [Nanoarchaeota archaeon]|nr:hypothetical protein [Nanoarchaeota archaeon]